MIDRERIKKILEAGAQAPSGSNSQPWKFRVRGNVIDVIAIPEKDHPILNFRYRGTWIAHGALIENINIALAAHGLSAHIHLFPEQDDPFITARIVIDGQIPAQKGLYDFISKRCTNRKPYGLDPLPISIVRDLRYSAEPSGTAEVVFITEPEKIKAIGKAAAVNDRIMFENSALHRILFKEIVWTSEEEREKGGGLLFSTMELDPPAFVVKMLRPWWFMNLLNKLRAARFIAKSSERMYISAPLMCAILTGERNEDFIQAGRVMQRIWLKATSIGFNCHLQTGVLFFWQRISSGEAEWFSAEHIELIQDAYQKVAANVGAGDRNIGVIFRIGKAGPPTGISPKLPPVVEWM